MKVIAVDPGLTTGLAAYDSSAGYFEAWECEGGFDGVFPQILPFEPDVFVVERFAIRPDSYKKDAGAFSETTDIIGAIRLHAQRANVAFVTQTPAEAKGFADNAKLRKIKWWTTTEGGHANDAARHLLTYLAKSRDYGVLARLTDDEGETR